MHVSAVFSCFSLCFEIYDSTMLSVRLAPPMEKKLTTFAKKSGKTKAACVREAILEYFENIEDIFTATHRLKHPSKKYSFEELKRELGI